MLLKSLQDISNDDFTLKQPQIMNHILVINRETTWNTSEQDADSGDACFKELVLLLKPLISVLTLPMTVFEVTVPVVIVYLLINNYN